MKKQLERKFPCKKKNTLRSDIHFLRKIYNTQTRVMGVLIDILNELKKNNVKEEDNNEDNTIIIHNSNGTCPSCEGMKIYYVPSIGSIEGIGRITYYYHCPSCGCKWVPERDVQKI